jgi:hypothetical protein
MNRKLIRSFAAEAAKLRSPFERFALARQTVDKLKFPDLTPEQCALSTALVDLATAGGTWFHGAGPGLAVGDTLLPAKLTGRDPRRNGRSVVDRTDHVFITPHKLTAAHYAGISGGCVFVVRPIGKVEVEASEMHTLNLLSQALPAMAGFWASNPWSAARAIYPAIQGYVCRSAEIVGDVCELMTPLSDLQLRADEQIIHQPGVTLNAAT